MSNTAQACIFCDSQLLASAVTHIVPESLGGPHSPVAPPGVTCDSCNHYFGQKVEAQALRSFPFVGLRVLEGIPSKKGRYVEVPTMLGSLRGTGFRGVVNVEPRTDAIGAGIASGEIRQVRLLAEVTEPLAICRLLLKIGLELLAKHYHHVAISPRVAEAREFARRPKRGARWWCALHVDPAGLIRPAHEPGEPWSVEIVERDHHLYSVLRLSSVTSFVPLESGVSPPEAESLPQPLYRVVWSTC